MFNEYKLSVNPVTEYGTENVQEAMGLLRTHEKYGVNSSKYFEKINKLSKNLQKLNQNLRWKEFKYDVAVGNRATLKSVEDEAMAGIACEEQGLTKRILTRSMQRSEEFVDDLGQAWDVKTAKSYAMNGKYIFDPVTFVDSITKEFPRGEKIIINITQLEKQDLQKLYTELRNRISKNNIEKILIVHIDNPSESKTPESLLAFLEK